MSVALLIEVPPGNVVAVRFPSADLAMDWADEHGIYEMGRPPIVTKAEALRMLSEEK